MSEIVISASTVLATIGNNNSLVDVLKSLLTVIAVSLGAFLSLLEIKKLMFTKGRLTVEVISEDKRARGGRKYRDVKLVIWNESSKTVTIFDHEIKYKEEVLRTTPLKCGWSPQTYDPENKSLIPVFPEEKIPIVIEPNKGFGIYLHLDKIKDVEGQPKWSVPINFSDEKNIEERKEHFKNMNFIIRTNFNHDGGFVDLGKHKKQII